MKLVDVLLLGLTIMFLIIGLDQAIVLGFNHGYWAFMIALVTFFLFGYRKAGKIAPSESRNEPKSAKKSNPSRRKQSKSSN